MDGLIFQIVVFLILFAVGWGFGRHIEQKHLRELDEKEKQFAHIRIDTNRFVETSATGQLVSSNVVISHDYFKYGCRKILSRNAVLLSPLSLFKITCLVICLTCSK